MGFLSKTHQPSVDPNILKSKRAMLTLPIVTILILLDTGCMMKKEGFESFLLDTGSPLTTETSITSTRPIDSGDSFRMGYGYDRLSGVRTLSCLDPTLYKLAGRNVRATSKRSVLVSSKEDLAKELNIEFNAEASATYQTITASASSKTDIMKKATFSTRTVMALLSFVHRAQSIEIEGDANFMSPASTTLLKADNKAFRLKCGDAYTKSVTTGAAVYILAQLTSKASEITDKINTEQGIKVAFDTIMSANASTKVSDETKKTLANFSITIDCISVGVNASACAEPIQAIDSENIAPVVEYMNNVKKSFAESVNSNPNMLVAIDENFEDYPRPVELADAKKFAVFYDYTPKLGIIKDLLERETAVNTICNIQKQNSCDDARKKLATQISMCARQDFWPDCNTAVADAINVVLDASKASPGTVTMYKHTGQSGRNIFLDFNRYTTDSDALQPNKIYNLAPLNFDRIATDFKANLKIGWQLRVFEKPDGGGRCFMITSGVDRGDFGWFNDKASSFRLERQGDYPTSCD